MFSSPKIALKTVDLPAPFGPMMVVIEASGIVKLTPFRIVILP